MFDMWRKVRLFLTKTKRGTAWSPSAIGEKECGESETENECKKQTERSSESAKTGEKKGACMTQAETY